MATMEWKGAVRTFTLMSDGSKLWKVWAYGITYHCADKNTATILATAFNECVLSAHKP